jgi:hypothetical protein
MTYFEKLDALKGQTTLELETAKADYLKVESELASLFAEYVLGQEIHSTLNGTGIVVGTSGDTLDTLIITVDFATHEKQFSLMTLMQGNKFVKFADILEIGTAWDEAIAVHTELTKSLSALEATARQLAKEAAKKEAKLKSAEASFERQKTKMIKDFEAMTNQTAAKSDVDEFYYTIGWLANHIGTMRAFMPDYLEQAFVNQFGNEALRSVVDSTKRTVNGFPMQWALSFKASLPKASDIPALLIPYLSSTGKDLANTQFIWDLVDNYGFKFSKEQDKNAIEGSIPTEFLPSYYAGLTT